MVVSVTSDQSTFVGSAIKDLYAPTALEFDEANGIDPALSAAFKAAQTKDGQPPIGVPPSAGSNPFSWGLSFLNSLSSAQLATNSDVNLSRTGGQVFTWGQVKDYMNAASALFDRINTLTTSGSGGSSGRVLQAGDAGWSKATPEDAEATYAAVLLTNMNLNRPGALVQAQQYVAVLKQPSDKITFSATAVQAMEADQLSYEMANRNGNWPASDSKLTTGNSVSTYI